jgi:hypothetical protein
MRAHAHAKAKAKAKAKAQAQATAKANAKQSKAKASNCQDSFFSTTFKRRSPPTHWPSELGTRGTC